MNLDIYTPDAHTADEIAAYADGLGANVNRRDAVLDLRTLVALSTVAEVAQQGSHVRWTDDEGETIRSGTARSIGDMNFGFLNGTDVRDGYLRVTGDNGREYTLAVMDVAGWLQTGSFAVDR